MEQEEQCRDCIVVSARVPFEELGFLNSIIDAYDNIAVIRTRDRALGLIEFWVVPDFYADFCRIVDDLVPQLGLDVSWPDDPPRPIPLPPRQRG